MEHSLKKVVPMEPVLPYYVINILLTRNNLTDTDKLFFEKKGTKNAASMGNLRGADKTVRQNKLIFFTI